MSDTVINSNACQSDSVRLGHRYSDAMGRLLYLECRNENGDRQAVLLTARDASKLITAVIEAMELVR